MEVRVKYEIASKSTISSISFNSIFSILAVTADGNDTTNFFNVAKDLSLTPKFSGESKPPASGCVSWSPSGLNIIVANVKVEIWKFDGYRLSPVRIVNEGFVEIKNISWSHDSQSYLCYGINHKDAPLSITIRNIESNEARQIVVKDVPVMANFDPFGKYISVLTIKNILELYDAQTLEKLKTVSMAETLKDSPTLHDRRIGTWSPEYSYLAIPNLNDSKMPTAILLDRNRSFNNKDILIGHQATISCCKFNPHIYEYNSDITFILAVGDSSGCISIWRIGKNGHYGQPLMIFSSPTQTEESIDSFEWNNEGNILIVNCLKKYVNLIGFREENLGKKLEEYERNNLIIGIYGASGAGEITGKKLEIFGESEYDFKEGDEHKKTSKVIMETSFKTEEQSKEPMIKTKQEVIINRDGNNREKKRIIPSRFVPESQIAQTNETNSLNNQNAIISVNNNPAIQLFEIVKTVPVKLAPLKGEVKKEWSLRNGDMLHIENVKNVQILSIRSRNKELKDPFIKRFFNGQIKCLTITRNSILIISNEKLYNFNFDLSIQELPFFIGEISNFTANNSGTVFFLNTQGTIKGLNYIRHEFILETSVACLLSKQSSNESNNEIVGFAVFDDDEDKIHVQVGSNLNRYFFEKETNSWREFNIEEGLYVAGHSLKISNTEKAVADNFYTNIMAKAISSPSNEPNASSFELQLIYYDKYAKDPQKYKEILLKMISDLRNRGQDEELRKNITKYFIDIKSPWHINDPQMWQKVKTIGGKIIEEFVIIENI